MGRTPGDSRRRAALVALAIGAMACSSGNGGGSQEATGTRGSDAPTTVGVNEDGVDARPPLPTDVALPIVFVHGFAGSAQQYESQAMRFIANGYAPERIVAFDHDGAGVDIAGYVAGVDDVIDRVLAELGADQVYLVGHSRGTGVSDAYLSDPAQAAKVAKCIAIDGTPCPDVVPCLAVTQATNPGQSHVEVATSKESFAAQYQFLVGEAPEVVDIVPQREPVVLTGRAVNFPANTGREGATLDVWQVAPETGARTGSSPHASFEIGADGDFGPLEVESGGHYEYVLSVADSPIQHHLYLQPYVRSSHLVRLLSSAPDGPTRTNTNVGDDHSAIIAIRMREWYASERADVAGDERDTLEISTRRPGAEEPAVNVIVGFVGNGAIGLHLHDDAATPGRSTLAALPYFADQPFQSGIDVFMPASDTPDGTITVTNVPRGDSRRPQTINVPNWPSSRHSISVVFTDFPID